MRLLQVVLAAGLLAHHAAAWPLFGGYDENYDYYSGDYMYDSEIEYNTPRETGLETAPETPPEEHQHHHHHHHHHAPPPDIPVLEGSGDAEDDAEADVPPELLPENLVPEDDLVSSEEVVLEDVDGSLTPEAKGGPSGVVAHGVVPTFKMPSDADGETSSPGLDAPETGSVFPASTAQEIPQSTVGEILVTVSASLSGGLSSPAGGGEVTMLLAASDDVPPATDGVVKALPFTTDEAIITVPSTADEGKKAASSTTDGGVKALPFITDDGKKVASSTNDGGLKALPFTTDEAIITVASLATDGGVEEASTATDEGVEAASATDGVQATSAIDEGVEVASATDGEQATSAIDGGVEAASAIDGEVEATSATDGGMKEASATDGGVQAASATDGGVKEVSATDGGVKEVSATDGGVKEVSATDGVVQAASATDGGVKEVSATDGVVQAASATDGGVKEVSATDGGVELEFFATDGGVEAASVTDGGVEAASATDGGVKLAFSFATDGGVEAASATDEGVELAFFTTDRGVELPSSDTDGGMEVAFTTDGGVEAASATNGGMEAASATDRMEAASTTDGGVAAASDTDGGEEAASATDGEVKATLNTITDEVANITTPTSSSASDDEVSITFPHTTGKEGSFSTDEEMNVTKISTDEGVNGTTSPSTTSEEHTVEEAPVRSQVNRFRSFRIPIRAAAPSSDHLKPNTTTTTTATTTTTTVTYSPPDKSCSQPPDPGVCRGHFPMFYFDPVTHSCLQFVYGGCRGNSNAFKTAKACYEKCHPVGFTRGTGKDKAGDYLKLHDGRGDEVFTFPGRNAALKVEDATLAEFSVRNVYQLEFVFRTDSPHGLIAFLRQTSVPPELGNRMVQLYVFLRRGHLAVTHIFCHHRETFLMRKGGLQGGNWHSSLVKINSGTGQLLLEVDGVQETFTITSLRDNPHFGSHEGAAFTSRLWIGGVFEEKVTEEKMVGRTENFHGCLKKIAVMSGAASEEMVWHKGLSSSTYRGVMNRCRTNCNDRHRNLCSQNSHCIEHFDHSTCNCFGSGMDGRRCNIQDVPILSLSNDGYVVHRLYDWMDRVHTYTNFISLEFRTRFTDSILFYGSSEYPEKQYIVASLTVAGTVYVEANLGGGSVGVEVGKKLDTGTWHTLTLVHQHNRIQVHLNNRLYDTLLVPGEVRYFHLDPAFYIGGAPNLTRTCGLAPDRGNQRGFECQKSHIRYYYDVHDGDCHILNYSSCGGNGNNFRNYHTCMDTCNTRPGLRSMHSFLGCMRNVFINDVSVLWELKEQNKTTRYHGATEISPLTDTCKDREQMILLTLSTEKAHVNLTHNDPDNFRLVVSFRPTTPKGVVASGYVDVTDTASHWEISHDENHVSFIIHEELMKVKPSAKININHWQYVEVKYINGRVVMKVNQRTVSENPPGPLTFYPVLTLGSSPLSDLPGMVGCLRKVELGTETVELRSLAGTDLAQKDVIYDGCRVLGPCDRPGSCEHGTSCTLDANDEIQCDCADSGYTGKTCHFSLYKTSCEEYYHIGYKESGIFKIDVDGNGPLPPSFVKCNFNNLTSVSTTLVENNLPEKYEVRGPGLGNLQVNIEYRDFSDEMLQALIEKSDSCSQNVRYDCRRSPLKLSTHTWFTSPSESFITSFGSKVPGLCRCKEISACDKADVACNCDAVDGLARSDVAVITQPDLIPLKSMVFLEDKKSMREESEGRITLGPLTCTTKATREQTVSFSKSRVYLEVPAWREGSLAFSFKTTSSRAMLAYQPAYHPSHATFRIALLGEKEVEFMYSYHGLEHRYSLYTARRLNTGEWQQVLVDIYHHQLRLLINSEQKLIDIEDNANLGVLDGSMFLGGMPARQDTWMNQEIQEEDETLGSLKGCIRDLTVNNELVDLDRYIRAAPLGVSASCQPSCSPNPCQNGAECIENWGSYECVCKNPLAHSGVNCEHNLNEEAITFTTEESRLTYFINNTENSHSQELANMTSLLLNFRTHVRQGLILFTYDYLHNFLQLHLASPNKLVLYFNSGRRALSLTIDTSSEVPLNDGQSVQVAIERDTFTTNLTVYTSGTFFNASVHGGLLPLQKTDYEQFPYGESTPLPDMVYYPHSFTKPGYFSMFYMGSANDRQADVKTDLPGLVGCVRGFQINEEPVVLHRYLADHPAEGVKKGCSMVCDHHPCLNGGVCQEDFLYPSNFHCDCSRTSYSGPVCSTETAYNFHGSEWLGRDAATSALMENLVFELAFSASVRRPLPQLVALIRGTDTAGHDDYILVAVESNGAVTVQAVLKNLKDATLIVRVSPDEGINVYSGHRHFVRVEWRSDGLWVTVDGEERLPRTEATSYRLELEAFPRSLYLGGFEEGVDLRFADYENFHGCISNVMISNSNGKVFPLQEYEEKDRHITNFGLPTSGSCSGFPLMPALVMTYRADKDISPVQGEDWTMRAAQRTAYDAPPSLTRAERNSPMDNVVPAVATCVILASGIILAILCIRTNEKKKKAKKNQMMKKEEEERERLLKDRKKSREEAMRARITNISEVEMAPLKATQNGGTQEKEKVRKINAANQQQVAPPSEPPPPIPTKEPEEEEEEVQVRTPKDSTADRPLSWDKSADALPLIGTEVPQVREQGEGAEDSASEGSSFDCTIDITSGSPSSSAIFPPQRDLIPADSPSSMRVNRGSNTMLNVDDDTTSESEPHLLHHGSLPTEEQEEVVEAPFVATTVRLLGGGEVQKITKTEEEDEIVVVDDYLEDKAALTTEYDSIKIGEVPEPSLDLQGEEEMDTAQQKESDLAEAAQETNQDSKATKKDQESKSTTDETENEAGKETASKKENENAEKPDSDDEFIELRPENEKVQNAERVTMQTWQEPNKSPANPTETQHHLHIPTDNLPIQKDKASEKYDEEETPQFKVEKVEAGAVKEEYFEGEKDDGRYSAMPPERQIEQRRSEDNQLKETDDKDDEYFECKSSASAPIPPEIVVSSPKEKESLNTEYLLSHIYKDKTEEEGKGEGETNVEKKPDEKESNVKNDYANNQDIQNETGTQENLKEDEELLDISAKLLLLDMAGQRNDGFSSPESYPGSPISEEDSPESPTYVNLYQEDDISLLNTGVSPRCSPGNLTPLDPISEHDESEEDKEKEGNSPRKTSLPTLFKSNLSSGVANLSALSAEDDAVKEMLTSEDEASKDTKDGKDEPDAIPEAKPEPTPEIHPEVDNEIPPEATPEKTLETAPEIPSDVADVVPEKPQETAPEKAPETPPEVPREEVLSGSVKRRRRRRKGRVTREKQSPVFLSEGVRTFSNPVSYFGGPNIKYEEEDGGAAAGGSDGGAESRLSIISNVSLD